mgnify:CR=1 FL=1
MSSEEVFDKVKEIIVEQLGVAENAVTLEASFIDDLGADSLDIVELIMALEEEFDIAWFVKLIVQQSYTIWRAQPYDTLIVFKQTIYLE